MSNIPNDVNSVVSGGAFTLTAFASFENRLQTSEEVGRLLVRLRTGAPYANALYCVSGCLFDTLQDVALHVAPRASVNIQTLPSTYQSSPISPSKVLDHSFPLAIP